MLSRRLRARRARDVCSSAAWRGCAEGKRQPGQVIRHLSASLAGNVGRRHERHGSVRTNGCVAPPRQRREICADQGGDRFVEHVEGLEGATGMQGPQQLKSKTVATDREEDPEAPSVSPGQQQRQKEIEEGFRELAQDCGEEGGAAARPGAGGSDEKVREVVHRVRQGRRREQGDIEQQYSDRERETMSQDCRG